VEFVRAFFQDPFCATIFSVVLGGVITWLAALVYYQKAAKELSRETALLRKANMAVVYMLEHPDASIEVRRDDAGNPIGLIVSASGHTGGTSAVGGVGGASASDS